MIQANELRLGNLIHFPYLGSNVEVIGIALKDDARLFIQTKLNNNSFFELPEKYNPIELTEEWLIKFGFRRIDKYTFVINGIFIHMRKRGFVYSKNLIVKTVHQLQNLYWCLTGKELIIK
jgi:hypothetical protein